MEQNLNIAEILRNKPCGIRLYSPIFGDCTFCYIKDETSDICVRRPYNEISYFNFEGLYNAAGECLLFPSRLMRNWSKFAWKKGDILVSNDGETMVIFDKWYDDTYTNFYCRHYFNCEDKNHRVYYSEFLCSTVRYSFKDNQCTNQDYLKAIEEKLGGKLNRETLEVEKTQPEFKDGDIVHDVHGYNTYIIKEFSNKHIKIYAGLTKQYGAIIHKIGISEIFHLRLATEEEKQQLFSALAKEGKAWNAEKKQIVDLKPKVELKPFDKVLVRNDKEDQWSANIFSYQVRDNMYYCLGECYWKFCIPYEGNERLLGTTDDFE